MKTIQQKGFSLPELLVALLIFSTIAAVSVVILRQSVDARDQLGMLDHEIANIEMARALIKDDMAQIALRQVRDEYGAASGHAFRGSTIGFATSNASGEKRLAGFVRRGWSNPNWEAPRATLQYVEYVQSDGNLVRRSRPFLDAARSIDVVDRTLLFDIDNAEIEFLAGENSGRLQWVNAWPVNANADIVPKAIAISTRSKHYGEIRQLFWIGSISGGLSAGDE